ncbi:hypothetical protein HYH02_002554 [Chlamydomonas schloesseri]|uniref:Uncharacterized protein n=1 Tax=Chlamydomonas schloesseri TaxID=2026947 RepID=A0A836BB41_9CHLO|nr:hypothetical protein HYH02_002554 [Chlamydomonas schloesseri]|eukprot:KAG2453231.1 hypothetical protein HYH02_002554 [Chlamydomonas schloesseri]
MVTTSQPTDDAADAEAADAEAADADADAAEAEAADAEAADADADAADAEAADADADAEAADAVGAFVQGLFEEDQEEHDDGDGDGDDVEETDDSDGYRLDDSALAREAAAVARDPQFGGLDHDRDTCLAQLLEAAAGSPTPCWREKLDFLLAAWGPVVAREVLQGRRGRGDALKAAAQQPDFLARLKRLRAAGLPATLWAAADMAAKSGHADALAYALKELGAGRGGSSADTRSSAAAAGNADAAGGAAAAAAVWQAAPTPGESAAGADTAATPAAQAQAQQRVQQFIKSDRFLEHAVFSRNAAFCAAAGHLSVLRLLRSRGVSFTWDHVALEAKRRAPRGSGTAAVSRRAWEEALGLLVQAAVASGVSDPPTVEQRDYLERLQAGDYTDSDSKGGINFEQERRRRAAPPPPPATARSRAFRYAARKGASLELLRLLRRHGAAVDLAAVAEGGSEEALEWAAAELEAEAAAKCGAAVAAGAAGAAGSDAAAGGGVRSGSATGNSVGGLGFAISTKLALKQLHSSGNLATLAWLRARGLVAPPALQPPPPGTPECHDALDRYFWVPQSSRFWRLQLHAWLHYHQDVGSVAPAVPAAAADPDPQQQAGASAASASVAEAATAMAAAAAAARQAFWTDVLSVIDDRMRRAWKYAPTRMMCGGCGTVTWEEAVALPYQRAWVAEQAGDVEAAAEVRRTVVGVASDEDEDSFSANEVH